jgi:hypothetical protein
MFAPRVLPLLAGLLWLSVPAPRAHADSLLFWDFENATNVGSPPGTISTATGAPQTPGISGYASQTGGGPDERFDGGPGIVHLTRFFGTYHPYIEFTVTRPMALTDVTFDHIHNHNGTGFSDGPYPFPTYPYYYAQLQLDAGSGYVDVGSPLLLEGSNEYHCCASIPLNVIVNPGTTYRIRWDPRDLAFGTDTNTEYFALNNLSLNGPAAYGWSGFLQPINADGSSIFKLGSTVPLKFALTGASAGITTLVATLYVAKVSDNVAGTEAEAVTSNPASAGSTFRYDATSGQYIYNWGTKGLSAGTYQLRIDLGDGTTNTVQVSLR